MEPFFTDYLERLQTLHEDFVAAFHDLPAEALDWVPGEDMNSFCVLVVHTTGSTRFWIGAALDDLPDRDRDAEFRAHGLSADELFTRAAAHGTTTQRTPTAQCSTIAHLSAAGGGGRDRIAAGAAAIAKDGGRRHPRQGGALRQLGVEMVDLL